jgi:hypothetical protein
MRHRGLDRGEVHDGVTADRCDTGADVRIEDPRRQRRAGVGRDDVPDVPREIHAAPLRLQ